MEIFGLTPIEAILFFMLYGISGVVSAIAAAYLLLRHGNAFASGVTPPLRLRRLAASFFAFSSLTHIWWLLFYIYSRDIHSVGYQLIVVSDCILMLTTIAGTMLSMLQDRRRPMWPVLAAMIPFLALGLAHMACPSETIEQISAAYLLMLCLLFTVYMVFAIRRYERWLNDNYADLENKKVWLSQVVAFFCMLLFVMYIFATGMVLVCLLHVIDLVLVGLLLWRVETLPTLSLTPIPSPKGEGSEYPTDELSTPLTRNFPLPFGEGVGARLGGAGGSLSEIEQLLADHCIAPQLYLQHDLTLLQLAQAIGTNRSYLSQYFSRKGFTYNAYINNLRIDHFINCYKEATAAGQPVSAQQLALESGFRSYSTFSRAFTQRTGQSVRVWMRETGE